MHDENRKRLSLSSCKTMGKSQNYDDDDARLMITELYTRLSLFTRTAKLVTYISEMLKQS